MLVSYSSIQTARKIVEAFLVDAPEVDVRANNAWRAGMGLVDERQSITKLIVSAGFGPFPLSPSPPSLPLRFQ